MSLHPRIIKHSHLLYAMDDHEASDVTTSQRARSFCVNSEINTIEWLIHQFAVHRLQSPMELFMNCKRRGIKRAEPNLRYYKYFQTRWGSKHLQLCNHIIEAEFYVSYCTLSRVKHDTCSGFHTVNSMTKRNQLTRLVWFPLFVCFSFIWR
jgi:hypothetical protein